MFQNDRAHTKQVQRVQARYLYLGGRITLINLVLSAMPLYKASVYKIPMWIIKTIDKACRRFLWVGVGERRAYSLVALDQICWSKESGDLTS